MLNQKNIVVRHVLALSAGICLWYCSVTVAAPIIELSQNSETTKRVFTADGNGLPEFLCITFSCSYTVSHATLFKSTIASSQPSTVLSALVDTAHSTFTVTVTWSKSTTPPASIALFSLTAPSVEGTVMFTKAFITRKNGGIEEVSINNVALMRQQGRLQALHGRETLQRRRSFALNGRCVATWSLNQSHGCYIMQENQTASLRLFMW